MGKFIRALFIVAKAGNQPRCPRSVDKWTVVHRDAEVLLSIKSNELLSYEKAWRNLNAYN